MANQRSGSASTAKKSTATAPVNVKDVELLRHDNKWLLRQGSHVIDVTSVMVSANYAMSRATLNIRCLEGR